MDFHRLSNQLAELYENWSQESVQPKLPRFRQVLEHVQGMTTANVLQLLNWAVACLEGDETYCEIGSFRGATLTDQGLKELVALERLRDLELSDNTQVTDATLRQLSGVKQLQNLDLRHTAVTDAGMKDLRVFRQLEELECLGYRGHTGRAEGVKGTQSPRVERQG